MKPVVASTLLESQRQQPRGKRLAPLKPTEFKGGKDALLSPRAEMMILQNSDLNDPNLKGTDKIVLQNQLS
jgi:hypothetical protein